MSVFPSVTITQGKMLNLTQHPSLKRSSTETEKERQGKRLQNSEASEGHRNHKTVSNRRELPGHALDNGCPYSSTTGTMQKALLPAADLRSLSPKDHALMFASDSKSLSCLLPAIHSLLISQDSVI